MKTNIFTFLMILVFSTGIVFAQNDGRIEQDAFSTEGKRVKVGLIVGTGVDWFMPKNLKFEREGVSMNFHVGIPIDINLTKESYYYFSTGLIFQHLGGKMKFESDLIEPTSPKSIATKRYYPSMYLTIPTGIKLKTPQFKNVVLGVNFGLYHSFLLSAKVKDKYRYNDKDYITEQKSTKEMAVFKEAAYIGIGGEFIIKNDFRAFLFVNYAYSFTNSFLRNNMENEKGNLSSVEIIFGVNF